MAEQLDPCLFWVTGSYFLGVGAVLLGLFITRKKR